MAYEGGMRDAIDTIAPAERPIWPALAQGWRRRCPQCRGGSLFDGYLKVADTCDVCGEAYHHHRADDAPAWATMIIVGHIVAPLMLLGFELFTLPPWAHAIVWPIIALSLVLTLLPRVKGAIVAFQWAHRMHGFDADQPDPH